MPVEVLGLSNVIAVAAGEFFSLALLKNGTVLAWGRNDLGQLGNGRMTDSVVPVVVKGLTGVAAISAGGCGGTSEGHSLALLNTGKVRSWGDNLYGELGDGSTISSDVPVEVKGLSNSDGTPTELTYLVEFFH